MNLLKPESGHTDTINASPGCLVPWHDEWRHGKVMAYRAGPHGEELLKADARCSLDTATAWLASDAKGRAGRSPQATCSFGWRKGRTSGAGRAGRSPQATCSVGCRKD